jgi:hypothetical protein
MGAVRLAFLMGTLSLSAFATDISGTWKAVFLAPPETRPKTVGSIVFQIKTDGNTLTGMAHVGSWPGDAAISSGRIEGDRISFVVTNDKAWRSSGPQGSASGYPRLTFTGTINGNEMTLSLLWDSIMIYGNPPPSQQWEMAGKKTDVSR